MSECRRIDERRHGARGSWRVTHDEQYEPRIWQRLRCDRCNRRNVAIRGARGGGYVTVEAMRAIAGRQGRRRRIVMRALLVRCMLVMCAMVVHGRGCRAHCWAGRGRKQ